MTVVIGVRVRDISITSGLITFFVFLNVFKKKLFIKLRKFS